MSNEEVLKKSRKKIIHKNKRKGLKILEHITKKDDLENVTHTQTGQGGDRGTQ